MLSRMLRFAQLTPFKRFERLSLDRSVLKQTKSSLNVDCGRSQVVKFSLWEIRDHLLFHSKKEKEKFETFAFLIEQIIPIRPTTSFNSRSIKELFQKSVGVSVNTNLQKVVSKKQQQCAAQSSNIMKSGLQSLPLPIDLFLKILL